MYLKRLRSEAKCWTNCSFPSCSEYGVLVLKRASLIAQSVKNLPAVQETWVQFLGREDPLEKEMAIHSGILAMFVRNSQENNDLNKFRIPDPLVSLIHYFLKRFIIYLFLVALGLHFRVGFSLAAVSGCYSLVVVCRLLVVVASLVVGLEHRLQ